MADGSTEDLIDYKDPEFIANPAPRFDRLRELDPVHWHEPVQSWLVSRHRDAVLVMKDRERFGVNPHEIRGYDQRRPFGAGSALEAHLEGAFFNMDRPEHTRLRRVTASRFTRAAVERSLTVTAEQIVDDLLDGIPAGAMVDVMPALGYALPQRMLTETIGLPPEDGEKLKRWTLEFHNSSDPELSSEQLAVAEAATQALHSYLLEHLNDRRKHHGQGDLMDHVLEAQADGRLGSDEDVINQLFLLIVANETTSTLICGAFEALERHPDAWQRLKQRPEAIPSAVEEFLRVTSPTTVAFRVALTDVELGGRTIRKGDPVQILLMAANRDPAVFPAPADLDLDRAPNPHVSFGGGEHTCLGAHLARLEARVLLTKVLQRWKRIHVALDDIRRLDTVGVWGYEHFPATIVPA